MKKSDICFIFMHLLVLSSSIDINNINENSQIKIQLNNNFYLTVPLYINDKEYNLPIDIRSDRTLININNNIDNQKNIDIILPECKLQDIEKARKKNTPISFFAKEITLDEIAYEEIDNAFENLFAMLIREKLISLPEFIGVFVKKTVVKNIIAENQHRRNTQGMSIRDILNMADKYNRHTL